MVWGLPKIKHVFDTRDRRIVIFGLAFFVIALLPFLGLGNLSPRYGYLASVGVVFLLVFVFGTYIPDSISEREGRSHKRGDALCFGVFHDANYFGAAITSGLV